MNDIPDSFLVYSAKENGEVESANELIKKAGMALKNGDVLSSDLITFISDALLNIADGMNPKKALYLNVRKGRPTGDNQLKIFATVEFLFLALGWKKEAAFDYASNLHHINRETVVKHYYEYRDIQEQLYKKFTGHLNNGAELKFQMMFVVSELPSSLFDEYLSIVI